MVRRSGFTLFEILIAVAILGTALVVVVGHVNHAVTMYRVARETVIATSLARTKLDEVTSSSDTLRERSESGTVKGDDRFTYRIEVAEYALPGFERGEVKGLYRAEVRIQWVSGATRQVKLVQIITQPT